MMMTRARRYAIVCLLVPLFGFGCNRGTARQQPALNSMPREASSTEIAPTQTAKPLAYVRVGEGKARVVRAGVSTDAQDGTELVAGDGVEATSGSVSLIYPDAGESILEQGTSVVVLGTETENGSIMTELRLFVGSVWTRFEKIFGANEQFSVGANGVVATVRGTAFGMSVVNGEVDVQVADHEVEIVSEEMEEASVSTTTILGVAKLLRVSAGEGVKIGVQGFRQFETAGLRTLIRKLGPAETSQKGYQFGTRRLSAERLRRPERPVRLNVAPRIPLQLERRMIFLRRRALLQSALRGFVAPTRSVLPGEIAPQNIAPILQGPTSTQ